MKKKPNLTIREAPAEGFRVAVCIETHDGPARERLEGIYRYALERNWRLFLARGVHAEDHRQIAALKLDGAILYDREPALHKTLRKLGVTTVEASARNLKLSDAAVFADDEKITRLASDHLVNAGFTHFGYFGSTQTHQSLMRSRCFLDHLAKHGFSLSVLDASMPPGAVSLNPLIQWLRDLPKPAGILTSNDNRAEQVLTACRSAGISVPDEIGVLGVGNDELMCELAFPHLSSIALPTTAIGRRAAEVLESLMLGQDPEQRHWPIAPLEVITRASTERHPASDPEIAAAIAFILDHKHQPIGTDQIAAAANLTRRTLERRFIAATSVTVHDFLVDIRLRLAKRLLRVSDASLGEIAARCGYLAPSAFIRMFNTVGGCHPEDYRQQYRESKPGLPQV